MSKENLSLLELGESLLVRGEVRRAEKVLKKSVRKLRGDERKLADAMVSLGVALYRGGKVKESLKTFTVALKLCERIGYGAGVARSYSGIGIAYSSLGKPLDEALRYHEKALEAAKKAGDLSVEARVLSNMGLTYLMGDKPEKALSVFREAVEKARMSGEKHVEALALTNLATAMRIMGRLEEEVSARRRAIELFDELGNVRDAAANRVELASALRQLRRSGEAVEVAERAKRDFLQIKDKSMVKVVDELIRKMRSRERKCPSCGAVILVEDLEYCPICEAVLVEEKKGRRALKLKGKL
ncbi:MAG: tetratricopeptide repeat protein [Candidatus Jordarchaeales archaeon]